ncbi:hypothetical protein DSO57_1033751 [Entomophthora muscae]|uniref:Uncharacterized protein n=1 Tax=Entomophthora muscae TaxID=34485 RepID=A0ACC2RR03_9FUNG|nr:hypothetical protein DSO57_1033751 [Entomophthora muscae]
MYVIKDQHAVNDNPHQTLSQQRRSEPAHSNFTEPKRLQPHRNAPAMLSKNPTAKLPICDGIIPATIAQILHPAASPIVISPTNATAALTTEPRIPNPIVHPIPAHTACTGRTGPEPIKSIPTEKPRSRDASHDQCRMPASEQNNCPRQEQYHSKQHTQNL